LPPPLSLPPVDETSAHACVGITHWC